MKMCPRCLLNKPFTEFYKDKSKSSGVGSTCKDCTKKRSRETYYNNPEACKAKMKEYAQRPETRAKNKARITELRARALEAYGNRCACCGETEDAFLTFDHVGGWGAEHRRTIGEGYAKIEYWLAKNNYPNTIQLLCWNCNCAKGIRGYCPHELPNDAGDEDPGSTYPLTT